MKKSDLKKLIKECVTEIKTEEKYNKAISGLNQMELILKKMFPGK
jgi:hypothetical protein